MPSVPLPDPIVVGGIAIAGMVVSFLVVVAGNSHAIRALGVALLISSSGIAISLFVDYNGLFCDYDQRAVCTTQGALVYFGALAGAIWTVIVLFTTARRQHDSEEESRASIIASHVGAWLPPLIGLIIAASTDHFLYAHYDVARFCFIDSDDSIGWPWGLFFGPAMLLVLLALAGTVLLLVRRRGEHAAMALYGLLFATALLLWCIMRILLDAAGMPVERVDMLADATLADSDDLWFTGAVAAAVLGVVLVLLLIDSLLARRRGQGVVKSSDGLDIKAADVLSDRDGKKNKTELKVYKPSNDVYDIDNMSDSSDLVPPEKKNKNKKNGAAGKKAGAANAADDSDDASLSIRMLDEASESNSIEPPAPAPMQHSQTLKQPVTYGKLSEVTRAPPTSGVVYEAFPPMTGTMEMSLAQDTPRSTNLYDHMVPREPDDDDDDDDDESSDDLVVTSRSARASAMPGGQSTAIENIIDQLADIVGDEEEAERGYDDDDDDDIDLELSSTSSSMS